MQAEFLCLKSLISLPIFHLIAQLITEKQL